MVVARGSWSAYRVAVILGPGRRCDIFAAASVVLMIGISGCTGNGSPPTEVPSPSPSTPRPANVTQRNPGWAWIASTNGSFRWTSGSPPPARVKE